MPVIGPLSFGIAISMIVATTAAEHAEVSMLALHLLQSALAHINALLLQAVLEVPEFHDSIGPLNPFWIHGTHAGDSA